jgi:iron(III) transport system permease protein
LGALAGVVCAAPALLVIAGAMAAGDAPVPTFFWESVRGSLGLALVGGGAATVLGVVSAWLVAMCAFPGRSLFSWALILPLAAPGYVLAYAYAALTWAGGPLPFAVSGFWGAAFIYALAFYPYVYLAARAAFASQSVCALEAARSLGASPLAMAVKVAAPLAWPGVAAGAALAVMEILADFGVAQYLGASTLTTEVFRAWFSRAEPQAALQLASLLLTAAVALMALERVLRGRRGFAGGSARWRPLPRYRLTPIAAALAVVFCGSLLLLAVIAPLGWLIRLAALRPLSDLPLLAEPLMNALILAGGAALVTLPLAALLAAAARQSNPLAARFGQAGLFAAGMGYAAPGAVIALGALAAFAAAREAGLVGGLTGATAITALLWTYAARFAAPGAQPMEAGLARVSRSLGFAARTLGAGPARRFFAVDAPIAAPSVLAAALIVFVEALKELPATLILRPFNFDTLAVRAYAYASDERLPQAAAPALLIVLAGLLPVILLSTRIERARAGSGA